MFWGLHEARRIHTFGYDPLTRFEIRCRPHGVRFAAIILERNDGAVRAGRHVSVLAINGARRGTTNGRAAEVGSSAVGSSGAGLLWKKSWLFIPAAFQLMKHTLVFATEFKARCIIKRSSSSLSRVRIFPIGVN